MPYRAQHNLAPGHLFPTLLSVNIPPALSNLATANIHADPFAGQEHSCLRIFIPAISSAGTPSPTWLLLSIHLDLCSNFTSEKCFVYSTLLVSIFLSGFIFLHNMYCYLTLLIYLCFACLFPFKLNSMILFCSLLYSWCLEQYPAYGK